MWRAGACAIGVAGMGRDGTVQQAAVAVAHVVQQGHALDDLNVQGDRRVRALRTARTKGGGHCQLDQLHTIAYTALRTRLVMIYDNPVVSSRHTSILVPRFMTESAAPPAACGVPPSLPI